MRTPFTGGCLCGAIRYRCTAEPMTVYYCHCSDCRRSNGSAFHVGVAVARASFEISKGAAKAWSKAADSGIIVTREFCADCGTPLFIRVETKPDRVLVHAGSLDDPSELEPSVEIWTDSKVPWAAPRPGIERFARGRPAPSPRGPPRVERTAMSVTDPNRVILTGENPFIRLSETDGGPSSTDASFWRIIFSAAGPVTSSTSRAG